MFGVGALLASMQPAVGPDPWRGILAVEQTLVGRSPSLSAIVIADSDDLTRDRQENILWWPPGQQMLVYALRRTGLSIGASIKTIVLGSWLVGMLAWAAYFSAVLGRRALTGVLIALFAVERASHASAFVFAGGEALIWALCPVVTLLWLASWRATGPRAWLLALCCGTISGGLVLFKYSGLILTAGVGIASVFAVLRSGGQWKTFAAWLLGAALGGAIWLTAMSGTWPEITPASAIVRPDVPAVLAWNAAGPLMALGDVYDAASTARRRLGVSAPVERAIVVLSIATLIVFLLWWRSSRAAVRAPATTTSTLRDAWLIASGVAITTSALLAVLMLRGGIISFEGRHQQYGAFLLMPFLAAALERSLRHPGSLRLRLAAVTAAVVFFLAPAAYGAIALVHQAAVLAPRLKSGVGPTGVRLDWTASGAGAAAFAAEIRALPDMRSALLATSSSDVALTFPESRVLFVLDRGDTNEQRYRGRPESGVILIAPSTVSTEDVEMAKSSFVDILAWTRVPIASVPSAHVWRGQ